MFIDVHCHLDLCEVSAVSRAKKAQVGIIVTAGTNHETNEKSLVFASHLKEVRAALGIYPIDALKMSDKEIEDEIELIRKNKNKIVAIGEVGMDFKENAELERQKKTFIKFIELAKELDKPVIVHSRKAEEACIEVLEKKGIKRVLMHCFSGNKRLVKRIENNGWFMSVPASVKHSEQFQLMVREVSISQLLCETDSPFLHPNKMRDNEPANVVESYKKISEIKGLTLKEVEQAI
ncbi:TatD family hydrolase, partial [Candidatus Pacearchaeota archaeon]|nr:TatD family hydrolase [Candidatus Pacearchaeota archaeon]